MPHSFFEVEHSTDIINSLGKFNDLQDFYTAMYKMTDVWRLPAIGKWEKSCGKHPTQKPLALLSRIILASTKPNAWVLDPFAGSSTTGIAANLLQRRYLGIEQESEFVELSERRRRELEDEAIKQLYRSKIKDLKNLQLDEMLGEAEAEGYGELPF